MTKLYLDLDIDRYTIEDPDPNDSWDAGRYGMSVSIHRAALGRDESWYVSSIETDLKLKVADTVYIVWARYSTGSTFGSDQDFVILDVFTDERQAHKVASALEKNEKKESFQRRVAGKNYYIPWDGYFECLEDMYVTELIVEE